MMLRNECPAGRVPRLLLAALLLMLRPGPAPAQAPSVAAGMDGSGRSALRFSGPPLSFALSLPGEGEEGYRLLGAFSSPWLSAGSMVLPEELGALADPLPAALGPPGGKLLPWGAFRPALPPASDPSDDPPASRSGVELRGVLQGDRCGAGIGAAFAAWIEGSRAFHALGLGARLPAGADADRLIIARLSLLCASSPRENGGKSAEAWEGAQPLLSAVPLPLACFRPEIALEGPGLELRIALISSLLPFRPPASALEINLGGKGKGLDAALALRVLDPSAPGFASLDGKASGSSDFFRAGLSSSVDFRLGWRIRAKSLIKLSFRRKEGRPPLGGEPFIPLKTETGLGGSFALIGGSSLGLELEPCLEWKADCPAEGGWEGSLGGRILAGLEGKAGRLEASLSAQREESSLLACPALPLCGGLDGIAVGALLSGRLGLGPFRFKGRLGMESRATAQDGGLGPFSGPEIVTGIALGLETEALRLSLEREQDGRIAFSVELGAD